MNTIKLTLLTLLILTSGCGSYSFGPPQAATPNVQDSIPDVSPIVADITANEAALQISKSVGNSAILFAEGLFGSVVMQKFQSLLNGSLFNGNSSFNAQLVSTNDEADFKEQARSHLVDLFLSSKSDDFCGRLFDQNYYYACKDFLKRVTFKITMNGLHSGVVEASFDSAKVASIDFAEDQMSGEILVSGVPLVVSALQSIANTHSISASLPSFSSGSGKVTVQVQRSGSDIQYTVQIVSAVDLVGSANGDAIHLQAGPGSSVAMNYARNTPALTATVNLQASELVVGQVQINLNDHLSGAVVFNHASETIQLQNIEISGAGIVAQNQGQVNFSLVLSPLSAEMSFLNDGFSVALQSALAVQFADANGSTAWSSAAGAKFTARSSNPVLVENQNLDMNNSGNFGSGNLSVMAGECFKGLPWEVAACI